MPGKDSTLKTEEGDRNVGDQTFCFNLPRVAIITVVGTYCNLRCPYCFYHLTDQSNPQIMSLDLLEKFIKEYLDLPLEFFTFNWHGGEPLLAGLAFFEEAVKLQEQFRKEGQKIRNLIQTNGTLINEEWASFFKTYNFGVGISLDGSRGAHDRFRVDSDGRGSFNKVVEGIKILRQYGLEPGVIQTLTHDNVPRAVDNFRCFVDDLSIKSLAINPYFDVDGFNQAMLDQRVTNREFTGFLKTYIDLWLTQDDGSLQIREIDNLLGGMLGRQVLHCDFNGLCWITFCLNYDGKIYFCDRFLGQEEFLCGDLSQQSLSEVFNSSSWQAMVKEVSTLPPGCRACKWRSACHNGCPHLRIGSVRGKYYYCQTRKNIFAYLEKTVETLLEKGGENHEG